MNHSANTTSIPQPLTPKHIEFLQLQLLSARVVASGTDFELARYAQEEVKRLSAVIDAESAVAV